MTKFQINSQFYSNICLIFDKEITNRMCSLYINDFEPFEISLFQLISTSSVFLQQLLHDLTLSEFHIEAPFQDIVTNKFINKIQKALNLEEIQLENDGEIINFSIFGRTINNEELLLLSSKIINAELSKENIMNIIKIKHSIGHKFSADDKEIKFVSTNFSELKEEILKVAENIDFGPIIELIIQNNNLKLKHEDELLSFLLKISNSNHCYEYLFEYVWLEYCSISKIKELIQYANENILTTHSGKALLNCFARRLIQGKLPIDLSVQEKITRYISNYTILKEYNDEDPLNGLLRGENEHGNVLLESSSNNENVYEILKGSIDAMFYSDDIPNSWIQASLKNKKSFILNKYMIRGHRNPFKGYYHTQTWKLEGQDLDGSWIELDSQMNQDISESKIKIYPIDFNHPIIAVRFTQTDKNNYNYNKIFINQFEIFGKIIQ